jgi:hypothetical protein
VRARNIKPAFFSNEVLAALPCWQRLLFIGLWTVADREGRLENRPARIKMLLFPCDNVDIEAGIASLASAGFLTCYEVDGRRLIAIPAWRKHQNPHHKEAPSVLPAPSGQPCMDAKPEASPGQAPDKPATSPGQAPDTPEASPADSGSLIPDPGSPIPDPGTPIPDPGTPIPDPGMRTPDPGSLTPANSDRHCPHRDDDADDRALRFQDFWKVYPVHSHRHEASRQWKSKGCDAFADDVIAHVEMMKAKDDGWKRGYAPQPATYLNGNRWEDEPRGPTTERPSPMKAAIDAARAKLGNRDVH